ncbi:PepSY domain-containing protein [Vibrio sp. SNU_ST1]|uniref:PepSY domain-containing protein n=1 Tax=Vibrio sp. SNU_ST1 TaxID=3064001 RepID=UPI00272A35DA|nr:PepSY domain-containing protein [Vibrio sp. SNU_ST1]WKY57017.1 PepSY domain-containing protein [Vibrio sp. SNU_ST1]
MKKLNWKRINRKTHYWGAALIALPIIVVLVSGLLLQVKKEVTWVQPASMKGEAKIPQLSFQQILDIASTVPEAEIQSWKNVSRMDVRPSKGIVKVRAKNKVEVQIDNASGKILQVAYRRSDLIESLHDGSFFHEHAKLWLFLPAAIILIILWISGIYMFLTPYILRRQNRKRTTLIDEHNSLTRPINS